MRIGRPSDGSMEHRTFEETAAIRGSQGNVEGPAVAMDLQGNVDAGLTERPDLPEQARQGGDRCAGHAQDNVAGLEVGTCRRTTTGDAENGHAAAHLGGIKPEPRPGGTVW